VEKNQAGEKGGKKRVPNGRNRSSWRIKKEKVLEKEKQDSKRSYPECSEEVSLGLTSEGKDVRRKGKGPGKNQERGAPTTFQIGEGPLGGGGRTAFLKRGVVR